MMTTAINFTTMTNMAANARNFARTRHSLPAQQPPANTNSTANRVDKVELAASHNKMGATSTALLASSARAPKTVPVKQAYAQDQEGRWRHIKVGSTGPNNHPPWYLEDFWRNFDREINAAVKQYVDSLSG